jgi:hypothetical protein
MPPVTTEDQPQKHMPRRRALTIPRARPAVYIAQTQPAFARLAPQLDSDTSIPQGRVPGPLAQTETPIHTEP